MTRLAAAFFPVFLIGCDAGVLGEAYPVTPPPAIVECEQPWAGEVPRLDDDGPARGLIDVPRTIADLEPESAAAAPLVVADLDDDGDQDIVLVDIEGPMLYANDGTGHFTRVHRDWGLADVAPGADLPGRLSELLSVAVAAVDINGDGLPELMSAGLGFLGYWPNRGDMEFADFRLIADDLGLDAAPVSLAHGDVDGDGWVDTLVLQSELAGGDDGVSHLLLLQGENHRFDGRIELATAGRSASMTGFIFDQDQDQNADVLILNSVGEGVGVDGLWHNTGRPGELALEDHARDAGLTMDWHAMGVDAADLNGDGRFDLVVSTIGPPEIAMSSGHTFLSAGLASGVVPGAPVSEYGTIGWSVDFADLDSDGWVELVQAGGRVHDYEPEYTDIIWQGGPGGFVDRTAEWGLPDGRDSYALATADFDGDGSLDVLIGEAGAPPVLAMNRCGTARWLEVDPRGPEGNRDGYGAVITVTTAELDPQMRPVSGLRGLGQGPSTARFGLGEDPSDITVHVAWPDGRTALYENVASNQVMHVDWRNAE